MRSGRTRCVSRRLHADEHLDTRSAGRNKVLFSSRKSHTSATAKTVEPRFAEAVVMRAPRIAFAFKRCACAYASVSICPSGRIRDDSGSNSPPSDLFSILPLRLHRSKHDTILPGSDKRKYLCRVSGHSRPHEARDVLTDLRHDLLLAIRRGLPR